MDQITDLSELLKHELKDLYSAETQIIDGLPKMIETAKNPALKKALSDHLKVTKDQKKRLEKIQDILEIENDTKEENGGFFANLFKSNEGEEHCKAMEGLIKEANSLMQEDMDPNVMDAAIIGAAQKIEHYEIGSYGTARAYAEQLGMREVETLLSETLEEEKFADVSLTKIAVGKVNIVAEGDDAQDTDNGRNNEAPRTAVARSNGKLTSRSNTSSTKRAASTRVTANKSPQKTAVKNVSTQTKNKNTSLKDDKSSTRKSAVKKRAVAKPPMTRKSAAKKNTTSRVPVKAKQVSKKEPSPKSPARNATAKKSNVKKASASKAIPKAASYRSASKKSVLKKSAPKKSTTRSTAPKKAAAKKSAVKRTATRNIAPKKAPAKKSAPKKASNKRTATKKSGAKKTARRR